MPRAPAFFCDDHLGHIRTGCVECLIRDAEQRAEKAEEELSLLDDEIHDAIANCLPNYVLDDGDPATWAESIEYAGGEIEQQAKRITELQERAKKAEAELALMRGVRADVGASSRLADICPGPNTCQGRIAELRADCERRMDIRQERLDALQAQHRKAHGRLEALETQLSRAHGRLAHVDADWLRDEGASIRRVLNGGLS